MVGGRLSIVKAQRCTLLLSATNWENRLFLSPQHVPLFSVSCFPFNIGSSRPWAGMHFALMLVALI
jgi:hypothetical protein